MQLSLNNLSAAKAFTLIGVKAFAAAVMMSVVCVASRSQTVVPTSVRAPQPESAWRYSLVLIQRNVAVTPSRGRDKSRPYNTSYNTFRARHNVPLCLVKSAVFGILRTATGYCNVLILQARGLFLARRSVPPRRAETEHRRNSNVGTLFIASSYKPNAMPRRAETEHRRNSNVGTRFIASSYKPNAIPSSE
jgi:hypothetical protein